MQNLFPVKVRDYSQVPVGGRIKYFVENWQVLTSDPWILECVQGVKLEFCQTPPKQIQPPSLFFNQEKCSMITKEVKSLLDKKAIFQIPSQQEHFLSHLFLVEKKGGGQRPVINLRGLNNYLIYTHFKMEGIHCVKDMIQKGDFMIKLDLSDAYLTVPIHQDYQKYLQFRWEGKTYQFLSLPFGISIAPLIFTKLMKVPISYLRRLGIRLIIYLDDILIMNQSSQNCLLDAQTCMEILEGLGFLINKIKSVLVPSQQMTFLGFNVDSVEMNLSLPKQKIQKIQKLCISMKVTKKISIRKLSELIGNLTASIQAIFPAPLHYRYLQMDKNQSLRQTLNYNSEISLSEEALTELDWWIHQLSHWNGRAILSCQPTIQIQTDASRWGWGAVSEQVPIGGPWLKEEKNLHINALELLAVTHAVKSYLKKMSNVHILIQTDSMTALTYINRMGGTVSQKCNQIALDLWSWCLQKGITLTADFIPGRDNLVADWHSRHQTDSSNWKLDQDIFSLLMKKTMKCNIDLFADRSNAQVQTYMSWLPDPGALAFNALIHSWTGHKPYAFPPFCLIGQCLKKIKTEKVTVVLVTPAWTSQPWYASLLEMSIQDPVLLPSFPQLLTSPQGTVHPLLQNQTLQLIGWLVSGNQCLQYQYQKTLKDFYLVHGEKGPKSLMIRPSKNGLAGVWKGKSIPLRPL